MRWPPARDARFRLEIQTLLTLAAIGAVWFIYWFFFDAAPWPGSYLIPASFVVLAYFIERRLRSRGDDSES